MRFYWSNLLVSGGDANIHSPLQLDFSYQQNYKDIRRFATDYSECIIAAFNDLFSSTFSLFCRNLTFNVRGTIRKYLRISAYSVIRPIFITNLHYQQYSEKKKTRV
jgi:hypothetical protein